MSYILLPDWEDSHYIEAIKALRAYDDKLQASQHPYAKLVDAEYALGLVLAGQMPAVIVGHYLMLYCVHPVWFNPQPMLSEQLLTTIPDKALVPFRELTDAMQAIAKDNRCCATAVGNSNGRAGLARRYIANGFELSNIELIKGHTWAKQPKYSPP